MRQLFRIIFLLVIIFSTNNVFAQTDWTQRTEIQKKQLIQEWINTENKTDSILNNLGYAYSKGIGIEQDYKKAFEYYEKAVQKNFALAYNNLGNMYKEGNYVEKNLEKALIYIQKAASNNEKYGMTNLAGMYEEGIGVQQNIDSAIFWYEKAVKLDHIPALNNLGSKIGLINVFTYSSNESKFS